MRRPPARHPTHAPPPLSRTRGLHHRGQVLWQERPDTSLLLMVLATREHPERVLGANPTHLYGAAPVPRLPLLAPEARVRVQTFPRTQEFTAIKGAHLVRCPPQANPNDPRERMGLSSASDWEMRRIVWAQWLAHLPFKCR